jgi:hypothetical protein
MSLQVAERAWVHGSFDWVRSAIRTACTHGGLRKRAPLRQTGFDYRGEETPTPWPATNSHFGVVDLAGFLKDDAHYYKAQFLQEEPEVHITPQFWEYPSAPAALNGSLLMTPCTSSSLQAWDLVAVPGGSGDAQLRSRSNASQCLTFVDNVYPIFTATCDGDDQKQRFAFPSGTGAAEAVHTDSAGTKRCLDVHGETGPNVGFYECGGDSKLNQRFVYDKAGGTLRGVETKTGLDSQCVTFVDGTAKQVWAYTNAEEVELFLNGASLGKQSIAPFDKGGWLVPYASGNLTAVGTKGGARWGSDMVLTPAAAAQLTLTLDFPAAGESGDTLLLACRVLDANGVLVRASAADVTFAVTGGVLLGTGNGDPSDHTPEGRTGSPSRKAWMGLVRAIVQRATTDDAGVTVTATAQGLGSATLQIP